MFSGVNQQNIFDDETSDYKDQFLANPDHYALAEHHLRRSLESIFDIGRHIIAKKELGKPEIYSHIFELLLFP